MSSIEEIQDKFRSKYIKLQGKFFLELGSLQSECEHEKTHWLQEIATDGSFKRGLFKRCFTCGFTIETLDLSPEFIEQLLCNFDKEVESFKLTSYGKKVESETK